MITPRFSLNQTDSTLTVTIRAPYCNLSELDISVEENVFIFFCKPYYLRLHLPGNIVEDDFSASKFDADTGEFTMCYQKETKGEHFPDLEFVTKFLTPKIELGQEGERKITILTNQSSESSAEKPGGIASEDEIDYGFGFAMQGHKNFTSVSCEFDEVFEVDPRNVSLSERRKLRRQSEHSKFSLAHYYEDYIEDAEIQQIKSEKAVWCDLKPDEINFTAEELDFLKDLSNIDYNLNELQIKFCHNCLLDILFAYCYDRRTTSFESTSESGWTINKLSASLCWLDGFEEPKEAMTSVFRRCLIYPLYRNFSLCQTVLDDLKCILELGEKYIIKCLIDIYNIFLHSDSCRYILNNLFIKDYIIYIMKWDKDKWQETVKNLHGVNIVQADLGLGLPKLEIQDDFRELFENLNLEDSDDYDSASELESDSDSDSCSDSDSDSQSDLSSDSESTQDSDR